MSYCQLFSSQYSFGLGLAAIGEKAEPVKGFLNGTLEAVFWMINKILKLAPIGVFAFICTTVMTFGASALIPLAKLVFSSCVCDDFLHYCCFGYCSKNLWN